MKIGAISVFFLLVVAVNSQDTGGFAGLSTKNKAADAETVSTEGTEPIFELVDCLQKFKESNTEPTWALMAEIDEKNSLKVMPQSYQINATVDEINLFVSFGNTKDPYYLEAAGTSEGLCKGSVKYFMNGNIEDGKLPDILFAQFVKMNTTNPIKKDASLESMSFMKLQVTIEKKEGAYFTPVSAKQIAVSGNFPTLPTILSRVRFVKIDTKSDGLVILDERQLIDKCGDSGPSYACINPFSSPK